MNEEGLVELCETCLDSRHYAVLAIALLQTQKTFSQYQDYRNKLKAASPVIYGRYFTEEGRGV